MGVFNEKTLKNFSGVGRRPGGSEQTFDGGMSTWSSAEPESNSNKSWKIFFFDHRRAKFMTFIVFS